MARPSGSDPTSHRSKIPRLRLDCGKHEMETSDLDCDLWERLPEDLLEEILAKLPFSTMLRIRRQRSCRICKSWRDLICSSQIFPRCTSRHKCLVFLRRYPDLEPGLCVFSFSRGIQETISLQFSDFYLTDVVASPGTAGLLCFYTSNNWAFVVTNPVTKCRKILRVPGPRTMAPETCSDLPHMPIRVPHRRSQFERLFLAGMAVDSHTGHFKLIVAGVYKGSKGTTLVYDSRVDAWKKVAAISSTAVIRYFRNFPGSMLRSTECGNNFYFYRDCGDGPYWHGDRADMVLRYDVQHEAWDWIIMPKYAGLPRKAIEHNGKLLWVTSTDQISASRTSARVFQTFELQEEPTRWLRADCLPLYTSMSRVREELPDMRSIECLGYGEVMFFIRRCLPSSEDFIYLPDGRRYYSGKMSVRAWFHNSKTNSDFFSEKWERYSEIHCDVHTGSHIFTPSTLPLPSSDRKNVTLEELKLES